MDEVDAKEEEMEKAREEAGQQKLLDVALAKEEVKKGTCMADARRAHQAAGVAASAMGTTSS